MVEGARTGQKEGAHAGAPLRHETQAGDGTYRHCLKIKEMADGEVEYKYYAPNVGVVKEAPAEGPMVLKTHS